MADAPFLEVALSSGGLSAGERHIQSRKDVGHWGQPVTQPVWLAVQDGKAQDTSLKVTKPLGEDLK